MTNNLITVPNHSDLYLAVSSLHLLYLPSRIRDHCYHSGGHKRSPYLLETSSELLMTYSKRISIKKIISLFIVTLQKQIHKNNCTFQNCFLHRILTTSFHHTPQPARYNADICTLIRGKLSGHENHISGMLREFTVVNIC
jgi:hypothetical protein